ncbi:hypothetical protein Lesp02_76150 [Lentzea sp. NBRC 105346]|uniref:hypothetical protein n=1 Tax=Lentzea sp. NBRC 105346 TaxID=3032205 RepID=UPI0024A202C1|nr:hypothetical protein [Lentzea sp. NBRC 105346]GLZ35428.1 hypothetical protein Lesp02_76150 [Lentzea sp. NBRC 105346]
MTTKIVAALACGVLMTACGAPERAQPQPEAPAAAPQQIDVLTHCGLEYVRFDGRVWRAETPQPEPKVRPDEQGVTAYTGYTHGTITVVDQDTARFTFDEKRYDALVHELVLRPAAQEPPLCD